MKNIVLCLLIFITIISCKPKKQTVTTVTTIDTGIHITETPLNQSHKIEDEQTEANYEVSSQNTKKVVNERFDFAFKIPENWKAIDKSNNGDGYFIETGNTTADIRIYGENLSKNPVLEELNDQSCDKKEKFIYDDKTKGTKCVSKNEVFYYYQTTDKKITFYIKADSVWMGKNNTVITNIAKSITQHKDAI